MSRLCIVLALALLAAGCDNPLAQWQKGRLARQGFLHLEAGRHAQALEACRAAYALAPERDDLRLCAALATLAMNRSDLFLEEVEGLLATRALLKQPWLHVAVVQAFLEQRLPPSRLPFSSPPPAERDGILRLLLARAELSGPWGAYGDNLVAKASPAVRQQWEQHRGAFQPDPGALADCPSLLAMSGTLSPWELLARGVCLWRTGDSEGALAAFASVQQLRPDILLASLNRALALAALGRVTEARMALALGGPRLRLSPAGQSVEQALETPFAP